MQKHLLKFSRSTYKWFVVGFGKEFWRTAWSWSMRERISFWRSPGGLFWKRLVFLALQPLVSGWEDLLPDPPNKCQPDSLRVLEQLLQPGWDVLWGPGGQVLQVFCEARTDTFHSYRSSLGPSGSVWGGREEEGRLWHQNQPLLIMCWSDYVGYPFHISWRLRIGPQENSHGGQWAAWLLEEAARGDSQEEVDGLLCTGPMTMW